MMRQIRAFVLLSALAWGQPAASPLPEPAPLVYSGKPITVPVACTEEDIQGYGLSCTAESPCPVYLELSALEVLPGRMILAGNLHTSAVALSSIVLASEDGGKTWTERHPRIRNAVLDRMQFFDIASGWVSGQIIGALPHDPFFLVTVDGGKTWRRRPVFGEAHLGSIENFHFTSAAEGRVLVDRATSEEGGRYALLETKTGGDSWGILQITSEIPRNTKFDRPASSAWRLQAATAAKAYQVEKREGNRWVPVVAFQVETGSCAPAEIVLTPPPDPATDPGAAAPKTDDAVDVFRIGGPKTKKPEPKKKKR